MISRFESEQLVKLIQETVNRRGTQYPNPAVGAMVIFENHVISEAFHRCHGEAHAETLALEKAGRRARGATLLITLEPCSHIGQTPPCVDAIKEHGIKRVVWALDDPNPATSKKAADALIQHGIDVVSNCMPDQAVACCPEFYAFHVKKRPYVYVKAAISLDGKIAPNRKGLTYISSSESLQVVQHLRTCVQAIVVGSQTICIDKPRLSIRLDRPTKMQPMIVILDPTNAVDMIWVKQALYVGRTIYLFRSARVDYPHPKLIVDASLGENKQKNWEHVLGCLLNQQIHGVLIEGGAGVFSSILSSGYYDELWITKVPKLLGQDAVTFYPSKPDINLTLSLKSVQTHGVDVVMTYQNCHDFSI